MEKHSSKDIHIQLIEYIIQNQFWTKLIQRKTAVLRLRISYKHNKVIFIVVDANFLFIPYLGW